MRIASPLAGSLMYSEEHFVGSRFALRDRGLLPQVVPRRIKRDIRITPLSIVLRFLKISADTVPRGDDMETVETRQRRPVYRCNFRPSPDCVGVDVGRGSDRSHQVEPTNEQDRPCESPLQSPPEMQP